MPKILFTKDAEEDITEITKYLDEYSLTASDRLMEEFYAKLQMLASHPEIGFVRPALVPEIRTIVTNNYLICYRLTGETITVVRILHGARDIGSALAELLEPIL